MREGSVLRSSISGVSCRRVLRRVIFAIVLMLAAGASLSTSAAALATPLGPWLPNPPIDLSTTGRDAESPQVATGPDGTTTITWSRSNGSKWIVQAATRAAGATTFSTPIDISTTLQDAYGPQVAIGPDGTTTITWQRYDGSNRIVQAATRAAGATTFSTPIDVSTTGQNAQAPQVAIGPDGTTTITWQRYDGPNYIVQAATRAAGATTFSTPIDLSTTGQNADNPQVATGPDGTTTITWSRSNGSKWIVQAATRAAGAITFSTPIDVSTTGQNAYGPQVATGPDGATTITWNRPNGSNSIVQAATRAAGATTFSAPIDVSTTGQDACCPQVATGPDGTTTISWTRQDGGLNYTVQAATRTANATTFSTPIDFSAFTDHGDGNTFFPDTLVATGPDGTTTITWTRDDGSNYIVQAATRAANATTFSTPIDLSTTGQNAYNPQVATGPDGTTTITWQRSNGTNTIVQAVTATPSSVLTITKTGNGTVTSTPANINCGTTCTATIASRTTITLTATPTAESTFSGWSGDCTGKSTCAVSMAQARNVTAAFSPRTPTKIRWNTGKGTTNQPITGSFTATLGVTYKITATSNATRRFQTHATRTARGTCKVTTNKKTKKRTAICTIRFKQAGTWLIKITPTQNGIAGTPATKTIKIRAATKKTRMLLARHAH